jgi:hypothetical protein
VVAACALGSAPAGADQLRVSISSESLSRLGSTVPVAPIAPGFVGVSIDYCSVTNYTGARANPVLVRLLAGLAPRRPVIRIGGDGTDAPCPVGGAGATPVAGRGGGATRRQARAIAALARRLGAKLILGINLRDHSERLARRQAALLLGALESRPPFRSLQAIEIGNEPDLYPAYGPNVTAVRIGPYFSRYLHDFATWTSLSRAVANDPTLPVAGPGLGRFGLPWISGANAGNFSRFVDGPPRPALVTFHTYPLLGFVQCPSPICPSMQNLLLQRSSGGLAREVAPFVRLAAGKAPLRADEMNSVTSGGTLGISNTFASALWAADTLFELAGAGVQGVNVHTFSAARYALFSHGHAGGWRVHPEYYGLLLFARAAPAGSQLLRVTPSLIGNVGAGDVKVWATRGVDGLTRVAVINKDPRAHTLILRGAGLPVKSTIRLARLSAPGSEYGLAPCPDSFAPTGLCATGAVSFGGRTFGAQTSGGDGGDSTSTGVLGPPADGTCTILAACVPQPPYAPATQITVPVPAGSAVLLTGRTPHRRREP